MNSVIEQQTNYRDMETRGFMVLPSFLSPDKIETLLLDHDYQKQTITNKNYNLSEVSDKAIQLLTPKLEEVVSEVKRHSGIQVEVSSVHIGYYFATQKVSFGWHQDHESYYALQNHYDYLNFFIPLHKPVVGKGNLSVIPWDNLKKECPDLYSITVKSGATSFYVIGDRTLAIQDDGLVGDLPFDIGKLGETPSLDKGDLHLIRGDIIHQTQDTETDRIAISIRLNNPESKISRKKLLSGGKLKTNFMSNNWHDFGPMIRAFQTQGKETMTWDEINRISDSLRTDAYNSETRGRIRKLILLQQKLATGNIISSYQKRRKYLKDFSAMEQLKESQEH